MDANEFHEFLVRHNACREAVKWANGRSLAQAWAEAPHFEWLLWLCRNVGVTDERDLRRFALRCARSVEHLNSDPRVRACNDVTERLIGGQATDGERAAARAAAWAAGAAADAAADAAARAAAWAAGAADAAADAAAGAAAAWAAAGAAAGDAARADHCAWLREMVTLKEHTNA